MSALFTKLATAIVSAFVLSLSINAVLGGNPFNRIGYAVFVSVVPGLVSLLVFKVSRFEITQLRVITIYTIYLLLFAMTIILQGVLRGI